MRPAAILLPLLLAAAPIGLKAQASHLGVSPREMLALDLNQRVNTWGGQVFEEVGTYQFGRWTWDPAAKSWEVPKGRVFILTDAQAFVSHEASGGAPAYLELIMETPSAGYVGTAAIFSFDHVPASQRSVQRQTWTSGLALPAGTTLRLWTQSLWPGGLLQHARILVHGYFAP